MVPGLSACWRLFALCACWPRVAAAPQQPEQPGWYNFGKQLAQIPLEAPIIVREKEDIYSSPLFRAFDEATNRSADKITDLLCQGICGSSVKGSDVDCSWCPNFFGGVVGYLLDAIACGDREDAEVWCADVPPGDFCLAWPEHHDFRQKLARTRVSVSKVARPLLDLDLTNVDAKIGMNTSSSENWCAVRSEAVAVSMPCPPSFYCEGGFNPPFVCPKGYHCPGGTGPQPGNCTNGDFCLLTTMRITCDPAQNSFGDKWGRLLSGTICEKNDDGRIVFPVPCPPGYYCQAGERFLCPVGYQCSAGSSEPVKCRTWETCDAPGLAISQRWVATLRSATCHFLLILALHVYTPFAFSSNWAVAETGVIVFTFLFMIFHGHGENEESQSMVIHYVAFLTAILFYGRFLGPKVHEAIDRCLPGCAGIVEYVSVLWLLMPVARPHGPVVVEFLIVNWCAVGIVRETLVSMQPDRLALMAFLDLMLAVHAILYHQRRLPSPQTAQEIIGTLLQDMALGALACLTSFLPLLFNNLNPIEDECGSEASTVGPMVTIEMGRMDSAKGIRNVLGTPLVAGTGASEAPDLERPAEEAATAKSQAPKATVEQGGAEASEAEPVQRPAPMEGGAQAERSFLSRASMSTSIEEKPDKSEGRSGIGIVMRKVFFSLPSGKPILSDVSLTIPVGVCVAVMGPSGSGKSSITNVLSGRAGYGRIFGEILFNGTEGVPIDVLRHITAFVPQDDVMHTNLTCFENVRFRAELQMQRMKVSPSPVPQTQRLSMVAQGTINSEVFVQIDSRLDRQDAAATEATKVLGLLGLRHVATSIIGDGTVRGISGGQRKRVSIAMEFVSQPSLLFLDEPTSGLDSTTSYSVVDLICKASRRRSCTSIAVIHQPRYEALMLFDQVVLLAAGGHLAYAGSTKRAVEYFQQVHSVSFPKMANPADVMMDIITFDSAKAMAEKGDLIITGLSQESDTKWFGQYLADKWSHSAKEFGNHENLARAALPCLHVSRATWGEDVLTHFRRASLQSRRNVFSILLMQAMLVGGLLAIATSLRPEKQMHNLFMQPFTALFFLMLCQGVQAQCVFGGGERVVAWREAGVGIDTMNYFLGRDFASTVEILLGASVFTAVYYPLGPLHIHSRTMFGSVFAFLYASWGINFIWSVAFDASTAQLVSVLMAFVGFLFSGMQPPFTSLCTIGGGYIGPLLMAFSPMRWIIGFWFYTNLTAPTSEFKTPMIMALSKDTFLGIGMPLGSTEEMMNSLANRTVMDRWLGLSPDGDDQVYPPNGFIASPMPLYLLGMVFRFVALVLLLVSSKTRAMGGGNPFTQMLPARMRSGRLAKWMQFGAMVKLLVFMICQVVLILGTNGR